MPTPSEGFMAAARIDARGNTSPISFALGGLPPGSPQWGLRL